MGHEVVADVVELGPDARGFDVGQRVVLNPWLSCAPRGVTPLCPACQAGDLQPVLELRRRRHQHGHPHRRVVRRDGWLRRAHARPLFDGVPCPRQRSTTSTPSSPTLSPSRCTASPAIRRRPAARSLVWGAGALGSCAVAILRALHPDVEIAVVARFDAQADFGLKFGAHKVVRLGTPSRAARGACAMVRGRASSRRWKVSSGLPMCHPGRRRRRLRHHRQTRDLRDGVRLLKARGTLVKSGVHAPGRWEWSPLYFKEISWVGSNAFGIEEVEGVRKHGIEHYLDLAGSGGRPDGMLTHTFGLSQWQDAFYAIADQEHSGAIKVAIDPAAMKVDGAVASSRVRPRVSAPRPRSTWRGEVRPLSSLPAARLSSKPRPSGCRRPRGRQLRGHGRSRPRR